MILKAVPATSFIRTIRRLLGVQVPPLVDASRLLPAPRNATAATWDRERHPCQVCGQEMTRNMFPLNPQDAAYFCLPCDSLVADEAATQLATIRSRSGKLSPGVVNQIYRSIAPGTIARDMHHAQQQRAMDEVRRNLISSLSTNKDLKQAPEFAELATLTPPRHHTGPLAARDIVLENTPRDTANIPTQCPATPIPEAREGLFADVEDEGDNTEKMPAIRFKKPKNTVEIPAMEVEVLLLETMRRAPVSECNTGENEQVTADAWLR